MHEGLPRIDASLRGRYAQLQENLAAMDSLMVAFSGGVDSTFLLKVAHDVLGDRALALTAVSPSFPADEREAAQLLARRIGVRQVEVETFEHTREGYLSNDPERCYFCKRELFEVCQEQAKTLGMGTIAFGAIADDLGDHRPGMRAAEELRVRTPLVDVNLSKAEIRSLSYALELETWDKPSLACLASRIPFGTRVTVERLQRVERAEAGLRALGLAQLRVRDHHPVARIELPIDTLNRIADPTLRTGMEAACKAAGFSFVAVDLKPFASGSMSAALLQS